MNITATSSAAQHRATAIAAAALATTALSASCSTSPNSTVSSTTGGSSTKIRVVAAENFWGSIATQLGGGHISETSIIANPDADPHDYEPTADDARTVASARFVITNGIGYDAWASKLLAANRAQVGRNSASATCSG